MTKRIVATLAAAAMALTAFTAAPAKALDTGEFGRLILGTGAVLLLGAALNEQRHRNRAVQPHRVHRPSRVVRVPAWCVHGHGRNQWVDWGCARRAGY